MPLIELTIPKILTRLNIFKNFHIFYRKTGLCSSFFFILKMLRFHKENSNAFLTFSNFYKTLSKNLLIIRRVKNLFEKWKGWEEEAKGLYAACVQWCIDKQLADSEKFKCLMRDTDKELKEIDNHILKLKDLDYSLLEIIMLQDELCEKYSIRNGDKEEEDT